MVKKRQDKIFNNSYYHGDKSSVDTFKVETKIEADRENILNQSSSSSLEPDSQYPYMEIQKIIMTLVDDNDDIQEILKNNKKKFNKQKINHLFEIILKHFSTTLELRRIKIHIYIFDVVSRMTGIKVLNLFDLLDFEYKQFLLDELDETYSIYKDFNKKNKYF